MAKFSVCAIFTPNNRRLQRETTNAEFRSKSTVPLTVARDALVTVSNEQIFTEFHETISTTVKGKDVRSGLEFVVNSKDGERFYTIEYLSDENGTPITDENIVKWAKAKVKEQPKIDIVVRGQEKTVKNTVERVLANVLLDSDADDLMNYSTNDLREYALDMLADGVMGYREMTCDELLKKINNEIVNDWIEENSDNVLEDVPFFS